VASLNSSRREFVRRIVLIACLTYACSNPAAVTYSRDNSVRVFVVHDAWHAALVIKKADIAAGALPELRDFPSAEYVEFSWGDRDYFPALNPGVGLALKAAFWSSGSILHVVGFTGPLEKFYPGGDIIDVSLSEEGFRQLIKFISDTFSRPHPPSPAEARPGLFLHGRFYDAEGRFSLLRTCNTWVAEALSAAGLPIHPGTVITAGNLSNQLKTFAAAK
jgi:uncharacterized protein (TIGR02117 family)